jgi:hypothetical protein
MPSSTTTFQFFQTSLHQNPVFFAIPGNGQIISSLFLTAPGRLWPPQSATNRAHSSPPKNRPYIESMKDRTVRMRKAPDATSARHLCFRHSAFGILSGFVIRPSDFSPLTTQTTNPAHL